MNLKFNDYLNMIDKTDKKSKTFVKGHVVIKDDFGNIILEKDNLVLLNTRVFLFEHLFKVGPPNGYSYMRKGNNNEYEKVIQNTTNPYAYDENRHQKRICMFTVGQGGADVNATPFNPYIPKFNDIALVQPVPFKTFDLSKDFNSDKNSNPSIVNSDIDYELVPRDFIIEDNNSIPIYYKEYYECNRYTDINEISNTKPYYAKLFNIETGDNSSDAFGWNTDYNETGELAYNIGLSINTDECRGSMINELGLIMTTFNLKKITSSTSNDIPTTLSSISDFPYYIAEDTNTDWELATRITFDSLSLTSISNKINIYYTLYI